MPAEQDISIQTPRSLNDMPASRVGRAAILASVHARGMWELLRYLLTQLGEPRAALLVGILTAAVAYIGWHVVSVTNLGLTFAISFGIAQAVGTVIRPAATMAPLAVPQSLAQAGLSGEVVAARLLDAARGALIGFHAKAVENQFELSPLLAGLSAEELPTLEIPSVKFSWNFLGELLRQLTGQRQLRISGEIAAGEGDTLWLRLRGLPGGRYEEVGPVASARLEELLYQGAEILLKRVAPYNLAFGLYRAQLDDDAIEMVRKSTSDVNVPPRTRAACCIIGAMLCYREGLVDEARGCIRSAHKFDRFDPIVVIAVASQAETDSAASEDLKAWAKRLAGAARRYASFRTDFTELEVLLTAWTGTLKRVARVGDQLTNLAGRIHEQNQAFTRSVERPVVTEAEAKASLGRTLQMARQVSHRPRKGDKLAEVLRRAVMNSVDFSRWNIADLSRAARTQHDDQLMRVVENLERHQAWLESYVRRLNGTAASHPPPSTPTDAPSPATPAEAATA